MTIKEYEKYISGEIIPLYESVGWTAYTADPDALEKGFKNSLLTLAAYEGEKLLGIVRCVGDGETIVFVQDILVYPEYQRQGIGTALLRSVLEKYNGVRQIELCTDDSPETVAFYRAMGFRELSEIGCRGFTRV